MNLFSTMTGLFGQKWTSAYGLADRNGEWLKTLNGLHPAQLEIGLNRVRLAGSEWPPTAPEFRKLCQPMPEELGLPTLAKAWREANEHASQPAHHGWSHRAVYLAGRASGWYELRNAGTAEECREVKRRFDAAYQALVNRECQGQPLEDQLSIEHQFDPAIHSNQLARESMAEQGIDPLDGQGARQKLMGMF
ncbi:replication protein P [Endozoicomonas sp. ALC013]|uniref:replication protein P n=2 Tax=unclassified Endozoicomonas TaxID=2644528 RepID=UPI003BB5B11B